VRHEIKLEPTDLVMHFLFVVVLVGRLATGVAVGHLDRRTVPGRMNGEAGEVPVVQEGKKAGRFT